MPLIGNLVALFDRGFCEVIVFLLKGALVLIIFEFFWIVGLTTRMTLKFVNLSLGKTKIAKASAKVSISPQFFQFYSHNFAKLISRHKSIFSITRSNGE